MDDRRQPARPPERRFTRGAGERTGGAFRRKPEAIEARPCPTSLGRRRTGPVLEIEQRRTGEQVIARAAP
jgi:hypothetical protein